MDRKRIVLLSCNDIVGGAAIVTLRLMHALRDLGHDARMVVLNKKGSDSYVAKAGFCAERGAAFLFERIQIFMSNGFNREDLFKVSTASCGVGIHRHPFVRQADVVMINWVNQGLLSLGELEKIASEGKKLIWTMHDMWCMTGICHHAYECERYMDSCGLCPFLGKRASENDLSAKVWRKKKELFDRLPIKFVAVSSWVKERALQSSLLKGKDIEIIHNAFPVDSFMTKPEQPYDSLVIGHYNNVISFGAASLDDPVKGVRYAVEALNILVDENPEIASRSVAIFFGKVRSNSLFEKLRFPYLACGTIADHLTLHQLYCASKVILSTSLYETLGGTLIEGQSSGAVPVSFGRGGQVDIIDHKVNGYIARYLDPRDVAEGIKWAIGAGIPRQELHQSVVDRFSSDVIARRYLELIDRI